MLNVISKALAALLLTALAFTGLPAHAKETITLQVHPYLPPSELLTRFSPLVEYLKQKTGLDINCEISKSYDDHVVKVGEDSIDIAYMGPASYVRVVSEYGNKPLLARLEINGSPLFKGVIITALSSNIRKIQDLKGKSFAFGDPNSTMSYLVPLYMLHEKGISYKDLSKYDFLKSHVNVALGVLMGDYDAGAVKEEVFYQYKSRGLRDVAWTPELSEHVFVTRKNLPDKTINDLRDALLNLKDRSVLTSIKDTATALVPVRDRDYDNLRNIIIGLKEIKVIP